MSFMCFFLAAMTASETRQRRHKGMDAAGSLDQRITASLAIFAVFVPKERRLASLYYEPVLTTAISPLRRPGRGAGTVCACVVCWRRVPAVALFIDANETQTTAQRRRDWMADGI